MEQRGQKRPSATTKIQDAAVPTAIIRHRQCPRRSHVKRFDALRVQRLFLGGERKLPQDRLIRADRLF
jgi:hypothetical protein